MAPPEHQLDSQLDYVKTLYLDKKMTIPAVAEKLSERVGFRVSRRTLERRLSQWGLTGQKRTVDTPELRAAVSQTFYQKAARNDREIYENIKAQGFAATQHGIAQLRQKIVGSLRLPEQEHAAADASASAVIQKELQENASEYGYEHMRVHLRQKGHNIARLYCFRQMLSRPHLSAD
jgi:hypothetical protein